MPSYRPSRTRGNKHWPSPRPRAPVERGPADALSFETGRLLIPAAGWSEDQIQQFRRQLNSEGWQLEINDGRMALSRWVSM